MSQKDAANITMDISKGSTTDLIRWVIAVEQGSASATVEDKKYQDIHQVGVFFWAASSCWLISHDDATRTISGIRRINDIADLRLLMSANHLSTQHQYPIGELDQSHVDGQPVSLDVFGRKVDIDSEEFQTNYHKLMNFPTRLINAAMSVIRTVMQKYASTPIRMPADNIDFLNSVRHLQFQLMRTTKKILSNQQDFQKEYREILCECYMTPTQINDLMGKIEAILFAIEIIERKPRGGLDKSVTMSIMSNCLKGSAKIRDDEKENLRTLNGQLRLIWDNDKSMPVIEFLILLSDCFSETGVGDKKDSDTHTAYMAMTNDSKRKLQKQPRESQAKKDSLADSETAATGDQTAKSLNDVKAVVGQLVAEVRNLKAERKENQHPNRNGRGGRNGWTNRNRNDHGQGNSRKDRSEDKRPEQYAGTAVPRKTRRSRHKPSRPCHSSDASGSESDEEGYVHYAQLATIVNENGAATDMDLKDAPVFDLYGRSKNASYRIKDVNQEFDDMSQDDHEPEAESEEQLSERIRILQNPMGPQTSGTAECDVSDLAGNIEDKAEDLAGSDEPPEMVSDSEDDEQPTMIPGTEKDESPVMEDDLPELVSESEDDDTLRDPDRFFAFPRLYRHQPDNRDAIIVSGDKWDMLPHCHQYWWQQVCKIEIHRHTDPKQRTSEEPLILEIKHSNTLESRIYKELQETTALAEIEWAEIALTAVCNQLYNDGYILGKIHKMIRTAVQTRIRAAREASAKMEAWYAAQEEQRRLHPYVGSRSSELRQQ